MLTNYEQIKAKALEGERKKLVVADAAGKAILEALGEATEAGMIAPVLVGDKEKIEPLVSEFGLENTRIVHETDPETIAAKSIELIKSGEGDMILKGKLSTPILMKAVLDKETGLRKGKLLSHVCAMEVAGYPKLMLVTDGGIVVAPDIAQKAALIMNATEVAHGLGIERPKVACLAAIERITESQPETLHAAELMKMAERGQLGDIEIEGPVAMDVLLSREAAAAKGIESAMTLDADIVLVPNMVTGNVFVKALIYLADAKVGGLVMGAQCPIVLLSRSDTAELKLCSIALACAVT
ncbi:phosphate butyryltransferase [bacterium]|mgnify:CR=1 FL=1|nr:MAG: phosphate butyryltransferase [bacterium]